jgi:methylphosphotriester-DNA--protein-cysteine methyltransferase
MKTHGRKSGLDEISDWERRAQQGRDRVKSLALSCGCTPRQLERYFARRFGITPHFWMDQLRLRDVRARLLSGELPKNLTQEVGFAHVPQLSFWCKRVSGQRLKEFVGVLAK